MRRRVVITGIGVVTSFGTDIHEFWEAMKQGKSAIKEVSSFNVLDFPTKVAAEITDVKVEDYIDKKEARRMDRSAQFAMIATEKAIKNSKLNIDTIDSDRLGVIIGSGFGGLAVIENQQKVLMNQGIKRISPFSIPMAISNSSVGHIAIKYQAKNCNMCTVTACASSNSAIGDAFRLIRHGYSDVMITGGTEAAITPLAFAGFCAMKAMSSTQDPQKACRPFDAQRDGFVMGEGAGIIIIEELEHARGRDADILAEIVGYGCTNDSYNFVVPLPQGEGAAKCMEQAIKDASISPNDISYINAHGTSTKYNDKCETEAIKSVFGSRSALIPISSTKSMTGHLLGASGAIETIISSLALRNCFLPPTINYSMPDVDCDLDYIPNIGRIAEIEYALSNSFGFGGHNTTLVLKRFKDGD